MLEAPVHQPRTSNFFPQNWSARSNPRFHTSSPSHLRPQPDLDAFKYLNLPQSLDPFDVSQSNSRLSTPTSESANRRESSMQSEAAVAPNSFNFAQLTPSSGRGHHRESSLSSLGSTGPASPYTQTTSHPQVALADGISGESFYDADAYSHGFSKSLTPSQAQPPDSYLNLGFSNYNMPQFQEPGVAAMMGPRSSGLGDGSTMLSSPADYGHMPKQLVANNNNLSRSMMPKLDRTMSDIYQDELFNPSFTITSAPSSSLQAVTSSPRQDVISQRLQAAKSQHLRASQSPTVPTRDRASPFREGSQFAPRSNDFDAMRLGSAAQLREQQKAVNDEREIQEHLRRTSPQQSTPKTISPKEAYLDYQATQDDVAMPLFSQPDAAQFSSIPKITSDTQHELDETTSQQSFGSMATSRRGSSSFPATTSAPPKSNFNFAPPAIPGALSMDHSYPFMTQGRRSARSLHSDRTPEFPAELVSMESSGSDYADNVDLKKPARAMADGGTYTCTYHGCTLRFETPAKLQKHKREVHRQSAPLFGTGRGQDHSMTSAALMRNSQAGPHKCERINPSTGKPCNTIFSRPYDLTRHEDTIHNASKQKVRCHLCTEEKKFSRNDAFTRHMRVVHPEVDFPSKTRRRAHD